MLFSKTHTKYENRELARVSNVGLVQSEKYFLRWKTPQKYENFRKKCDSFYLVQNLSGIISFCSKNVYQGVQVKKLERVGDVQKRVGTRFRNLKKK